MVEPTVELDQSQALATIHIPPAWNTEVVYTFNQEYKQGIAELFYPDGSDVDVLDDDNHNYFVNDEDREDSGKSEHAPSQEECTLRLAFRYGRKRSISDQLQVLEITGEDSITFTILAKDGSGFTGTLDESSSDMYAKIHLVNTEPPPKGPVDVEEPATESERAASEKATEILDDFANEMGIDPDSLGPGPPYDPPSELKTLPVGIIGAGCAGLYTAMILDTLGINYETIEGSGRHGGRILTHHFTKLDLPYQYFECGAMRFPNIFLMRRTFDLAQKKLGMGNDKFIKITMHCDNAIKHFNGIGVKQGIYSQTDENGSESADTFKIGITAKNKDGYIPEKYLHEGTTKLYKETLEPLRDYFVNLSFQDAFLKLMQHDNHSVRSYMQVAKGYPDSVIRWIEDMEWRTGGFDSSLTESVIASLSFDDPRSSNPDWFCFDGGTSKLIDGMLDKVENKPKYYKRVTAIKELPEYDNQAIQIEVDTSEDPRGSSPNSISGIYSNIISTLPLSVLRMVNLDDIYLSIGQKNALRGLQYQPSVKIGIQFKRPWWEDMGIVGGQSYTDRPPRSIVYPSYGPIPGKTTQRSNVLIAAYNGLLDSQRLAVYMKGHDTPQDRILLKLIMKDLAVVHNKPIDDLWEEYVDHYAWDWTSDTFSQGAFAWFGPGQFKEVYPHLTMPAGRKQRLFFAGDAVSTCHGWVVGAFNSAWRCVHDMLVAHPELNPNLAEDIIAKFMYEWGDSEEWDDKKGARHVYLGRELFKRQQEL
ncbi:hypothetical protein D9757_007919 [Collybiopsis confluens]|uniref:Amine oxidase domain-containing protein n=1 Tax=Collybiopsis confluens TaxID=2823264 RepID=A0A8H5HBS8_9AGAR|nr:hypothetical protein D9757_007919 [Collybiopsis confluens]